MDILRPSRFVAQVDMTLRRRFIDVGGHQSERLKTMGIKRERPFDVAPTETNGPFALSRQHQRKAPAPKMLMV